MPPTDHPHIPLGPGGEFDLVRAMLEVWGDAAEGIGDDAAVLQLAPGEHLVVSTDTAVEEVHFKRAWISPEEIGYRSTMAALSDLAAMAATPRGLLVAVSLPRARAAELPALAHGIGSAAQTVGAAIRGGDLTSGSELALTITVLGGARAPLGRSGVRAGDYLYVTGALSGPRRAVQSWDAGREPTPWCRERFARPKARIAEAVWLAARGAHALIDISDGLTSELRHLALASGVEVRLDVDRVPCGDGGEWRDALVGGEEYELVVAAPQELDVNLFARTFALPLTCVARARATDRPGVIARLGDTRVDLEYGHDHFSS
ncbi:MAG: thiamine-phosphate kinase [Gemmatimonadaceae bacterium]